ncbi:hypothetical protein ACIOEZ_34035 [Streptomyces sp. NPDC087866]|uniref:hypothetical protein n=1 Tax=Streptomyces sp. NPDC087866 TaxID=3365815 RepID=UPI00382E3951
MSRTKTRTRRTPKTAPAPAPAVDMRKHLPLRPIPAAVQPVQPIHPDFLVEAQTAAYHAALLADLPQQRIQDWTPTPGGGAHLTFPSGNRLQHLPGTDIPFTALTPCAQGAVHTTPISTRRELVAAVRASAQCASLHGRPRTLTLAQAAVTAADTQQLDGDDIADGLAGRAADTETAKEHPQP